MDKTAVFKEEEEDNLVFLQKQHDDDEDDDNRCLCKGNMQCESVLRADGFDCGRRAYKCLECYQAQEHHQ
jgi:hypothetical protein